MFITLERVRRGGERRDIQINKLTLELNYRGNRCQASGNSCGDVGKLSKKRQVEERIVRLTKHGDTSLSNEPSNIAR